MAPVDVQPAGIAEIAFKHFSIVSNCCNDISRPIRFQTDSFSGCPGVQKLADFGAGYSSEDPHVSAGNTHFHFNDANSTNVPDAISSLPNCRAGARRFFVHYIDPCKPRGSLSYGQELIAPP
jgi:hypothetical protein